jgi:hypothetical protein
VECRCKVQLRIRKKKVRHRKEGSNARGTGALLVLPRNTEYMQIYAVVGQSSRQVFVWQEIVV